MTRPPAEPVLDEIFRAEWGKLVATVIRPGCPASLTISASSASWRALSTRCGSPAAASRSLSCSEASTELVPTSTGRPSLRTRRMLSSTACHLLS